MSTEEPKKGDFVRDRNTGLSGTVVGKNAEPGSIAIVVKVAGYEDSYLMAEPSDFEVL